MIVRKGEEEWYIVPADLDEYPLLALMAKAEGCDIVDFEEYDPSEEPHLYVISALCRYFRSEIDDTFGAGGGSSKG